jgi:endoglucanase
VKILRELCAVPTAPFVEDRVMEYVERFVVGRRALGLSRDRYGNRLIELPGRRRRRAGARRLVFVAHADHPGLVARRMTGLHTLDAHFRGGVLADFVRGAKVRFFDGEREVRGVVTTTAQKKGSLAPHQVTVRVDRAVAPGSPGMFDLTPGRFRGGKFYSRVCDDLAGLAAALTMLDELCTRRPRATVAVLVTRAEEVGFVGAVAAATEPALLRKSDLVVSIECSAAQPFAPQGGGVILRVGDRTSIFNSSLSYFMHERAQVLAKRDKTFKFQRALMPGGSCEGTVFDAYGYTTAAACVALGNYHNMDRAAKMIAAEYVDVKDWRNMVRLFVELARTSHEYEPGMAPFRRRIERRFSKFRPLLVRESAERGRR